MQCFLVCENFGFKVSCTSHNDGAGDIRTSLVANMVAAYNISIVHTYAHYVTNVREFVQKNLIFLLDYTGYSNVLASTVLVLTVNSISIKPYRRLNFLYFGILGSIVLDNHSNS